MMEYTLHYTAGDGSAERMARQAVQTYCLELHAALSDWLGAHPASLDPVAYIAPAPGDLGLTPIERRSRLLTFLRSSAQPPLQELGRSLSQMPPVPRGSVDVIVSTPQAIALLRATPGPVCVS